ncbi:MAG: hypothetical protein A2157_08620 [Deltaproteobacteria bacterium RBG_16_47_11]|nr:MAG: hypothetical protein A2157_08620 [Deltaproteobacteria bacterium RBG_16_47_11]
MDILEAKRELQKIPTGNLLKMAMDQKLSRCLLGGKSCGYSLLYRGIRFCVSEVLGKGCFFERLGQWETFFPEKETLNGPHALLPILEAVPSSPGKNCGEFKVYYRDGLTRCMVYLGTVIERRKRERGNNLGDLLKKAANEYSNDVPDPSKIFLLGH